MREPLKLKEFCIDVLRYVGTGYKYYKIVIIPQEKMNYKNGILTKIANNYGTKLTQGQRQHRRIKGLANYGAVAFGSMVIILHTDGKNIDKDKEFKEIGKELNIFISNSLTLVLFKDERDKWTFRLSKETYNAFKGNYQLAFKDGNGKKFHYLETMWRGLPRYRGINQQRKSLNIFLKELKKKYKTKWIF
jgi:hypothetical protein